MRRDRTLTRSPGSGAVSWTRPIRSAAVVVILTVIAAMFATQPGFAQPLTASATQPQDTPGNPYKRGPDPTVAAIEATRGPFATASTSVPPGNGFNGGTIYYPTDTSLGTWGAVAIVPGYTALFANEEAWMGPWLSSFGFVVIGVETNTTTDSDGARATELLAALNYLTTQSPVHNLVDPNRLSVIGHSAGGAGAILAAEQQPSLKAAVGLAPGYPGGGLSLATDTVPMLVIGGQNDTVVTPSYLSSLYATMPTTTQSDFAQIAGADHVYYTHPNNVEMKLLIPWLKTFLDNDTRYTQFLCPAPPDPSNISMYNPKCPYTPGGGGGGTKPTTGQLHAVGAAKCLDVPNSTTTAGTQLQISDCSAAAPNQTFTHTATNQLTVYNGADCLDANGQGTSPGTKVIIWACNGQVNQQWQINANGTITGTQSGLCLDVSGASTSDGAAVQLWTCNGGSNQQWTLG